MDWWLGLTTEDQLGASVESYVTKLKERMDKAQELVRVKNWFGLLTHGIDV